MSKRVAIYARVSTEMQAEKYSIDEQIDKLRKYCDIHDYKITKEYVDGGFSGATLNRPAMELLKKDSVAKKFEAIIVYKLDRLSRSIKDTMFLIEEIFEKNSISFVSLSESFDTSTSFGKAMIGIMSTFAQLEREQIKERMAMGRLGRVKSGKYSAPQKPPFGYNYEGGQLVINAFESEIIKNIFSSYLSGSSIHQIMLRLNKEGHLGKNVNWSMAAIRYVLENVVYAGYVSYLDEKYKGNHDNIISLDTWKKAQDQLDIRQNEAYSRTNNSRPFQSKYMLSGLLVCAYCGCNMKIRIGNRLKSGKRSSCYKCISTFPDSGKFGWVAKDSCIAITHNRKELEQSILERIEQFRISPDMMNLKKSNDTSQSEIDSIKLRISEIDKKLERLVDLYLDGSLSRENLDKRKNALNSEHDLCVSKISRLIKEVGINDKSTELQSSISSIQESIFNKDYEFQKKIVRKTIKKITVSNDTLSIEWAF